MLKHKLKKTNNIEHTYMYSNNLEFLMFLFSSQIQGTTDPNSQLTNCVLEPLEAAMYNEGTPEFVVDQGMYYPSATNYGYICTGNFLIYLFFFTFCIKLIST